MIDLAVLFDLRYSWMQPSLRQRLYEAWRRVFMGDRYAGEHVVLEGVPYRIRRGYSITKLHTWETPEITRVR